MSGGRDFTAPERPAPEGHVEATHQQAQLSTSLPVTTTTKFQRTAKVRAASLVDTQLIQTDPAPRPAADPESRQAIALAKIAQAQIGQPQIASAGLALQGTGTAFAPGAGTGTLQLNSIQGGLEAMTTQFGSDGLAQNADLTSPEATPAVASESYLDIREIRASRVNMRQGPGTIYPVMSRLLAGDEVLILEDSGTGWLQLRTRKGNKIGWVAASLVSKKRS
ncbi:SH3 domain-containing protein [Pseudophaeobacter leonis]|uniref:SH3 domain-containing protein n=1 Tax=Pseudophaeobacter leonis TaxID=1144477 RepID=UPI001374804B|nr:SH3 domain-containing protein [Pseudophaeobacter leonis]